MDQQQATDFIQQQLLLGRNNQEIVELLSSHLKAPPELVKKFVDKVIAQATQTSQPPLPVSLARAEQPFAAQPPVESPAAQAVAVQPPAQAPVAVPAESSPAYTVLPKPEKKPARPAARTIALDDPLLAALVVKRLKAQHRKSDIAMEICERTGADWKESLRFVNQVFMEQYHSINRARNLPVLIFCGLFVFAGLVLMIVGAIEAIPYVAYFFSSPSDLSTISVPSMESTIYYLLGGVGLVLGGLAGFYLALRPQSE